MTLHLPILIGYSVLMVALGLIVARRVQSADSFFVASRGLGPGLLFATMLAPNIGAGSTIGAASLGYKNGLAAWWWVGSAGIGSLVLAFWIGPRIRKIAAERGLRTVGDYLEQRYSPAVRTTVTLLLWIGTLAILAGQLFAISTLLTATAGTPKWVGCVLGGVIVTVYFAAGGLSSAAWVNVLQVFVKLLGFAVALPMALAAAGGWTTLTSHMTVESSYWSMSQNGPSGWMYLALLGPSFIVSPALLQKTFGARDDRAVRIGIGANALFLLAFSVVPPILGIIARDLHPSLAATPDLALPTLLVHDVPLAVGALGLAAIFSAELSAADAILFMLATSLSQDLYKRIVNRAATDRQILRVARIAAIVGGILAIGIALKADSIIGTLSFFYSVLSVCLFVPIVAGLFIRRVQRREAMAAIVAGIVVLSVVQLGTKGAGLVGLTPVMCGLAASIFCAGVVALFLHAPAESPSGAI